VLVARLDARAVLVGSNFRFGHRHAGNMRCSRIGAQTRFRNRNCALGDVPRPRGEQQRIRELIRTGRVPSARFLQHAYSLEGHVVSGRGIGSKLTVPR